MNLTETDFQGAKTLKKIYPKGGKHMKHLKRFVSVLLTMAMVMAMALTASAATANLEGHTYKAYQIFSGNQSEDPNDVTLTNIQWGDGINAEAFLAALKADGTLGSIFDDCTTAADVAEELGIYKDNSDEAKAFAKIAYANITTTSHDIGDNLSAGYYLVVDETDFGEDAENTVKNLALLQMTKNGEFTAANKTDVPEVEKKVKDINDSTDETTTDWQDSADHDINDTVPFQLKATLADNVTSYETYKIVFHDTLSAGLKYNKDAKVYFNGEDVTSHFVITDVTAENGETTLTILCADVKVFSATDNSVITVEYTATLNEKAVLGSVGNPNKVYLEYSNNPNNSGEGNNETGKTPEDVVIVFTYKTIINKVDSEGKPLTGAEFTLEKYNKATGKWETITGVKNEAGTTFTFSGLDDGKYRLTETKTPVGYNSIDPIEFTVTAEHEVTSNNPQLKGLSGGNASTGELTFTSDITDGSLSADVVNQSGAQLPETGGIGTTIFYVIGSILVLGAAVVMITRKRMAK